MALQDPETTSDKPAQGMTDDSSSWPAPSQVLRLPEAAEPLRSAPNRYAPVTPWKPLAALGATVLVMLVCALIIGLTTFGILMATPDAFKAAAGGNKLKLDDPGISQLLMAAMLTVQLAGTGLLIWLARWKGGSAKEVLALRAPVNGWNDYAWAVPAFIVFGFGGGALMEWLWPKASQADTQMMLQLTHSPAWWLILVVAVVGAPLSEELMFRGFLFSALARSRLGLIGTALVTSIFWAAIHGYSLQGDLTIFGLGLALSFILWRTGSTRVTMLCHGAYNSLAFLAAFLTPLGGGTS